MVGIMIIDPFLNNPKTLYYKKFMSHLVNDELLENIWEQVQEEFPFLPVEEQEQLAKQMFEDRCQ